MVSGYKEKLGELASSLSQKYASYLVFLFIGFIWLFGSGLILIGFYLIGVEVDFYSPLAWLGALMLWVIME
jgi:hypothetical protein